MVLVCPPVFRSGAEARDRLGRDDWLARQVVNGSSGASVACSLMCLLRRPAAAAVARAAHAVPEDLARDGVQHSWPSYRGALDALLDDNPLPAWIDRPAVATTVILGSADPRAPAEDVLGWPHENVRVLELPGDHLLPLTQAPAITAAVRETLDRPVRGIERAAAPSPNAAATCGVRQPRRERRRS